MMSQHPPMNRGYSTNTQDSSVPIMFQEHPGAGRPGTRGVGGLLNPAAVVARHSTNTVVNPRYSGESFYAEIPGPGSSVSSGPTFRDMKSVEYKHNSSINNGLQVKVDPKAADPYMNLGAVDSQGGTGRGRSPQLSDFDSTFYNDPARVCCSKITTLHVVVMALLGLVYLVIGGVAGYFYAKSRCGSANCDAITQETTTAWNLTVSPSSIAATPWLTSAGVGNFTFNDTDQTDFPQTTPDPYTMHCQQEAQMCVCGPFGGNLGRTFSDSEDYANAGNVTDFTIRHNDYFISSLSLTYGGRSGDEHGYAMEGVQTHVTLLNGERIHTMEMDFTQGQKYLTQLTVYTNLRVLGPYGGVGANTYYARGDKLLYVDGRSGPLVDQLILYFNKCL